jgi:Holliday junction resolvase RusA-like endonuclease
MMYRSYMTYTPTINILDVPMPPSVNKAYVSIGRGRRKLSLVGRLFKQAVKDGLAPHLATDEVALTFQKENLRIKLEIHLFFKSVTNKGYPKTAKNRYKRLDVSNRIKLLEDALFEALDIDDAHVFELVVTKSPTEEGEEDFCDIVITETKLYGSRTYDGGPDTT